MLNWGVVRPAELPADVQHTKVLRVGEQYTDTLSILPNWLAAYPGHVWIVGNEPDVSWSSQDNVLPEVYADRYFHLATRIRDLDPAAQIGFGPIAQPTPLRMRYMDRVIAKLDINTGSRAGTLALIDIFTPHVFLVNEQLNEWGANIPQGFENDHADAFLIDIWTESYLTHDITTFSRFVTDYRIWMKELGAQDYPLWITEYTSVLPPIDPPNGDVHNTSDEETTAYMLETFDFIMTAKDPALGYPADDDRLVQRGYWYSLNEYRYSFGGTLFDPDTKVRTMVGEAYETYEPPAGSVDLVDPDVYPISTKLIFWRYTPGSNNTRIDYRLQVRVGNHVVSDLRPLVTVRLRNASGGPALASAQGYLARCGGDGIITLDWLNVQPDQLYDLEVVVVVDPGSGVDTDFTNNTLPYPVTPYEPYFLFQPMILR